MTMKSEKVTDDAFLTASKSNPSRGRAPHGQRGKGKAEKEEGEGVAKSGRAEEKEGGTCGGGCLEHEAGLWPPMEFKYRAHAFAERGRMGEMRVR